MGEAAGPEQQGVTLVTLMPTGFSRLVKHVTLRWVIRHRSLSKAGRRFWRGQQKASAASVYLEALNFIHFGRWIIIAKHPWSKWRTQGLPHFPDHLPPPGQPKEKIKHGVMLFTSNFDFDWRPYVDTFTETAMDDLGVIWNSAPDWRNPTDAGYDSFFNFVDEHVVKHGHYYVAFPRFATGNMKSALFVDRAVRSFDHQTADFSDVDWDLAYQRLVAVLQRDLGTIRPPKHGSAWKPIFANGGEGNLELTFLAPLPRDNIDPVMEVLRKLADGISPFMRVPGTHFGRLTVIHEVRNEDSLIDLESGYILLSVDSDGLPGGLEAWLLSLHTAWSGNGEERNLIDEIWGSCYGFGTGRTSVEFVDYMMKVSYQATLPFSDYPGVSLWDIQRAAETQDWFTDLVFGDADPSRRVEFNEKMAASRSVVPS